MVDTFDTRPEPFTETRCHTKLIPMGLHQESHQTASSRGGMSADSQCDFCSNPETTWLLPADDFKVPVNSTAVDDQGNREDRDTVVTTANSLGGWLACDDCKTVLDEGGVAALVERVGSLYRMVDPTLADPRLYDQLSEGLTQLYTAFQMNRTGDPVPHER